MRVLGVDLGTKRIGLALSDREGRIASPLMVLQRQGGKADLREVVRVAVDYEAEMMVIGLPVNLRGERAEAAQAAEREIQSLRDMTGIPVEVWDERLTSAVAQRDLAQGGLDTRAQRRMIDKVAAAIMLQSYLEYMRRDNDAAE